MKWRLGFGSISSVCWDVLDKLRSWCKDWYQPGTVLFLNLCSIILGMKKFYIKDTTHSFSRYNICYKIKKCVVFTFFHIISASETLLKTYAYDAEGYVLFVPIPLVTAAVGRPPYCIANWKLRNVSMCKKDLSDVVYKSG